MIIGGMIIFVTSMKLKINKIKIEDNNAHVCKPGKWFALIIK